MMGRYISKRKRTDNVTESQPREALSESTDGGETSGQSTNKNTSQACKKRKVRPIQDEHRKFQEKWTEEYFFVLHDTNPVCLICQKECSGFKRGNLERHFRTTHALPTWK